MNPAARLFRASLLAAVLASAAAVPLTAAEGEAPRVSVRDGKLVGKRLAGGGALFAAIPYAAPPTGPLRWTLPKPPRKWQGERDASLFGPTCPQIDMGWNRRDAARMDEDCLNLNVWVPASGGKRLPVMVWIHGGGFIGGSGSSPTFDGEALIRENVILVTLNYRLGVFGFLAHPGLSTESKDHISGNYGVADQMAALEWVQRNIAAFGGDPANVTLFGQSAGSISTANLVAIPEARRTFKRAIMESGTAFGVGNLMTLAEAEADNADLGAISDLRARPVGALLADWGRYAAASPYKRRSLPVVDGHIFRAQPMTSWLGGAASKMSILLGSNVVEMPAANRAALVATAEGVVGTDAERIVGWYEARGADGRAGDPSTQMMTDMLFRCGTTITARSAKRAWLYHFLEDFPGRGAPAHSAEVFYIFGTPATGADGKPARPDVEQEKLALQMRKYWTNFARSGDPQGADLPAWPAWSGATSEYAELGVPGARVKQNLRAEPCQLFSDIWTGKR